jgi:hypothetical protein
MFTQGELFMNKSDSIKDLATALSSAQSEIRGAIKDAENPFFKSSYADLESIWESCREIITTHGLSVTQLPTMTDDGKYPALETTLMHSSGQWISGKIALNPVKPDPQSMGSAISYMRRYSLAAVLGIYQKDDDGEAAMGRRKEPAQNYPSRSEDVTSITTVMSHALNAADPEEMYVPFGKNKGRKIKDIGRLQIEDDLKYWNKRLAEEGKMPTGALANYLAAISAYLTKLDDPSQAQDLPF